MKRKLQGIVVSDKMTKTILVEVESIKKHAKYHRRYKVHKKYQVHDGKEEAKVGDLVVFEESKPLSKNKRWILVEIKNITKE